jgi:antitoxin FitA
VQALRERAAQHGRSVEAEHREILAAVLRRPKKRTFAEALAAIPNVGKDEDFVRVQDTNEAPRVFG